MNSKLSKILLLLVIITFDVGFSQKITPISINNEIFELPGKWEIQGKNENSGQYAFNNKKLKNLLLISVRKITNFEFYNQERDNIGLLNDYYDWETKYWTENDTDSNVEVEKYIQDDENIFVIWRIKLIDKNLENFIIGGIRNEKLITISLTDNKDKPKTKEEIIKFLKDIYFNKTKI